jgi:prepilin-type N-terminal cleavage/methylation domain-containing protein
MHKGVWSETMRAKCFCNTKKGFSLIEVIIALAILMIVVLGLISSYYSYYRNMVDLRIKTTGQNLAQLQLEDIQNLSVSVIDYLVTSGSSWSDIYDEPNYPGDSDGDLGNSIYDSGKMADASFRIEHLTDICGETLGDLPADLLLPSSIEVIRVPATGLFDHYNITLHKEVFPNYKKQIVITDKTTSLDQEHKIFGIEVTVYWDVNGVEKSITVTGEKSYARSG